jgi:hypothetical protein
MRNFRYSDPVTLFSVEMVADFQQAPLLPAMPANAEERDARIFG